MSFENNDLAESKQLPAPDTSAAFREELSSRMPTERADVKEQPVLLAANDKKDAKEPVYNASPEREKLAKELAEKIVKTDKISDELVKALTAPTPNREPHMLILINQELKKKDRKLEQTVEAIDGDFGLWTKLTDTKNNKLLDKRKI